MSPEFTAALGTWITPAILVALVPLFIGSLRRLEERMNRRMDNLKNELGGRIDDLKNELDSQKGELNSRIDDLKGELGGRIDRLENRLNVRMDRFESRLAAVEHGLAKMEGLLEGLREAVAGRRDAA